MYKNDLMANGLFVVASVMHRIQKVISVLDSLREMIMSNVQISEVQLLNLSALLTIRDSIQRDLIAACCKFGLSAEQAHFFHTLSIEHILAIVASIGQESLFLPRQDLLALVKLPAPLAGPIIAVHPPHKAASTVPQQGSSDSASFR